jgi:hypothetical protein
LDLNSDYSDRLLGALRCIGGSPSVHRALLNDWPRTSARGFFRGDCFARSYDLG